MFEVFNFWIWISSENNFFFLGFCLSKCLTTHFEREKIFDLLLNTHSLNKSWAWHIDDATNKKIHIILWSTSLTNKMKCSFFQTAIMSILLYGCTTWMLTKQLEKKLDGNYSRMQQAILNKSWRQHPTKQQLYGHLPPIMKTIKVRWIRHTGHCWRSRDKLISDVLLWTSSHGRAKAGQPAWTYVQQLCENTGCSPEDLLEAINDREGWWERTRDIRADSMTRWWWDDEPSNGTCQNLSPIGLLVYKLQLFKWSYCCKFSKQWKKSEFLVDKACFLMGKKYCSRKGIAW